MTKLTIVRGVSGSGKSTWANQQNATVVSRDLIRLALFGTESMADENRVTNVEHNDIRWNLQQGRDVISDNTNIEWKYVKAIAKIGHEVGAVVEIKVFDVPLQRAIDNNARRAMMGGRDVPVDVIRKQHQRFQGNKNKELEPFFYPMPYNGTPGKPEACLVDIDGTLAHMKDRSPYEWKRVGEDDLDEVIAGIVDTLSSNYKIIVMSGRDGSCRDETIDWLDRHDIIFHDLFMRPVGDFRPDNIIKAELFNDYVRPYFNVKFVLDDRKQVVDMWRRMGLTCLQVAEGNF